MLQSSLHTPHVFDDNFATAEAILIILGALEREDQGAFSALKILKNEPVNAKLQHQTSAQ